MARTEAQMLIRVEAVLQTSPLMDFFIRDTSFWGHSASFHLTLLATSMPALAWRTPTKKMFKNRIMIGSILFPSRKNVRG
jgi:hypothetical protein